MADIIFHPEAQEEYEEAVAWYQARSSRAASRFEAEVQRVLDRVQLNPQSFPLYDDEHRFAILRQFPYTVFFQLQAAMIYVVAVAHGRRYPGYWRGRT